MRDVSELVERLTADVPHDVPELLRNAVAQQEAITPALLAIIERDSKRFDYMAEHPDYAGHIFSIFLLAQFREPKAYPLIVNFFSDPEDDYEDVFGCMVTEDLPQILASIYDGNDAPLRGLIENRNADEYCRIAAVNAFVCLVDMGIKTRDEVLAFFDELLKWRLAREAETVLSFVVCAACDLNPQPCMETIREAFKANRIDPLVVGLRDVEKSLTMTAHELMEGSRKHHPAPVKDVPQLFEQWDKERAEDLQEEINRQQEKVLIESGLLRYDANALANRPEYTEKTYGSRVRIADKTLPNDPCPCGSDRKYKKCCGRIH